jgi:hypothetical protein
MPNNLLNKRELMMTIGKAIKAGNKDYSKSIKRKRIPNPSVEYFKTRIERAKEVEKICREICRERNIDPDALVTTQIPAAINNLSHFPYGYILPEKCYQKPAWCLFAEDVEIIWHHIALNGKAFTGFKK